MTTAAAIVQLIVITISTIIDATKFSFDSEYLPFQVMQKLTDNITYEEQLQW